MTTQPKDLMTLEETINGLYSYQFTGLTVPLEDQKFFKDLISSALHHLEAGRRAIADAQFSERTLKILNDIAEDIDCGDSRGVLRKTISEMADKWMHLTQQEHLKRLDAQMEAMLKLSAHMEALSTAPTAQEVKG